MLIPSPLECKQTQARLQEISATKALSNLFLATHREHKLESKQTQARLRELSVARALLNLFLSTNQEHKRP
jgi:hypothetical protein